MVTADQSYRTPQVCDQQTRPAKAPNAAVSFELEVHLVRGRRDRGLEFAAKRQVGPGVARGSLVGDVPPQKARCSARVRPPGIWIHRAHLVSAGRAVRPAAVGFGSAPKIASPVPPWPRALPGTKAAPTPKDEAGSRFRFVLIRAQSGDAGHLRQNNISSPCRHTRTTGAGTSAIQSVAGTTTATPGFTGIVGRS